MAVFREIPYGRFNFLVQINDDGSGVIAGFSEVTGLDANICVTEYRAGNYRRNTPIKVTGLTHYTNIHLKRGILGSLDLYEWFDKVSKGDIDDATKDISIILLNEERDEVLRWNIYRARPVALQGTRLEAEHCAVAIEELVLAHEGFDLS